MSSSPTKRKIKLKPKQAPDNVPMDVIVTQAAIVFNSYLQCHISPPDGCRLQVSHSEGVGLRDNVPMDVIVTQAAIMFNSYLQCHISPPDGCRLCIHKENLVIKI